MPRKKDKAVRDNKAVKDSSTRKKPAKKNSDPEAKTGPEKVRKAKGSEQPQQQTAGANRSEGIRLFKLAGRPTKEEFALVYGEAGPRMTWEQRAKAGIPAEKFQAALAAKQRGD